jgi:hypothetical protein
MNDKRGICVAQRGRLEQAKKVQGCVSLLFHPEWFLIGKQPLAFFKDTLALCKEMGADLSGALPTALHTKRESGLDQEEIACP